MAFSTRGSSSAGKVLKAAIMDEVAASRGTEAILDGRGRSCVEAPQRPNPPSGAQVSAGNCVVAAADNQGFLQCRLWVSSGYAQAFRA